MARKNFRTLMDPVMADPERRARVESEERAIQAEIAALGELRRARSFTQEQLARSLGSSQPMVARLEKQADLYVSTLRSYVEAMGGHLTILAEFPDTTVRLQTLGELAPRETASPESLAPTE